MKKFNLTALSVMLALGLTACQPPEAEKPRLPLQAHPLPPMPTVRSISA